MGTIDGCLSSTVKHILTFEASLRALTAADKGERDSGAIYCELTQISEQSTTQMWHDPNKQITKCIVHTHNKLTLHVSVCLS